MDLFSWRTLGLSAGGMDSAVVASQVGESPPPGWLLARLSAEYVRLCGPGGR
jgi:hypothetical protein